MRDDAMTKTVRVAGKVLGAAAMVLGIIVACTIIAWLILKLSRPQDTFLFLILMSAFSGLLIASLTVYRMVTAFRSATLTLLLTLPMMISLMATVIGYWVVIRALVIDALPWSEPFFDFIGGLLNLLDSMFG